MIEEQIEKGENNTDIYVASNWLDGLDCPDSDPTWKRSICGDGFDYQDYLFINSYDNATASLAKFIPPLMPCKMSLANTITDLKEKTMSTENMIKAFKEIVDDWRKEQLELINEEEENVEMTLVNADPVCSDFDMLRKDYIISVQQLIEDNVDLDEYEKKKLEKLGKKAFNDSVEEMTDFLIEKTKDKLMLLHTCGEVARNRIRNHVSKVKLLLNTASTHEEANKILVANHIYDEDGSYNPTKVCESVWTKKQIQAAAQ